MSTTIQLDEETLELLKRCKEQTKAKTYDEVIRNFMRLGAYAKSFRGYLGKKKADVLLKDLRDKGHRI